MYYDSEIHGPVVAELAHAVMHRTSLPDNPAVQRLRQELQRYEHEQPFMDFVADLSRAVSDIDASCLAEYAASDRLYEALGYGSRIQLPQIVLVRPRVWPDPKNIAESTRFSDQAAFLIFGTVKPSSSVVVDVPCFSYIWATERLELLDILFEMGAGHQTNEHFFVTMKQRLPMLQQVFDALRQLPAKRSLIAEELLQEIKIDFDDIQEQLESLGIVSAHLTGTYKAPKWMRLSTLPTCTPGLMRWPPAWAPRSLPCYGASPRATRNRRRPHLPHRKQQRCGRWPPPDNL